MLPPCLRGCRYHRIWVTRVSGRGALAVVVWDGIRFSLVRQQAPLWLSSFHPLLAWHHPRCLFRAKGEGDRRENSVNVILQLHDVYSPDISLPTTIIVNPQSVEPLRL